MKKALALTLALLCAGSWAFGGGRTQRSSVPTLVWYQWGPLPDSPDLAENVRIMSDYTQEKIGVRFELRTMRGKENLDLILNSGEPFDILFTQHWYPDYVSLGVFADITDLIPVQAPALWNYNPPGLWDAARINGRIYAVPAYKDISATIFLFWDKKYVDKYNLDTSKRPYTLEDFDRDLRIVKAGEGPNFYPMMQNTVGWFAGSGIWDDSVGPYLGVRLNDQNRQVMNVLEQPERIAEYKMVRSWYRDGILHPDTPQLTEVPRGRAIYLDLAWPSKAQTIALLEGIEAYVPVDLFSPSITTIVPRFSLLALSTNSRYKNESLKLIELINTDHKFRDMLAYGIEGKHFRYVSPNVVERLSDNYLTYEWAQGTFFNLSTTTDQPTTTWDEVRAQNERAVYSPLYGFTMDNSSIQNEIANVNTVGARYIPELVYGNEDIDVLLPRIIAELNAVGLDRIRAEAQRQIDAFFK
jgi:putative aldouronate transport system substrate-binding protein